MEYYSTRNKNIKRNFKEIVMQGLSEDGGLYVPVNWSKLNIAELKNLNYSDLAFEVIFPFSGNIIPEEDLRVIINNTYNNFHHPKTAPLLKIKDNINILELFYGPTFAFKDYALQFLGNLFEYFLKEDKKNITIIGATSGDTGSAAIDACRLKKNISIFILHPYEKVSDIQRRQMTTVLEDNVHNIAVKGNFDDCQKIIKNLFVDDELISKTNLAAINSINWARILAQAVYYFWAYFQLEDMNKKIDFIIPSGNFGNVYAGHLAGKMGLPIDKLHVVSNSNDILHRTISKGDLSIKKVKNTYSPSMDIQIPSNLERQLFESLNDDVNELISIMKKFIQEGKFQLDKNIIQNLNNIYTSHTVDDNEILQTIKFFYEKYNYLSDPHTATGLSVLKKIEKPNVNKINLACAHPAKFSNAIKDSINREVEYPDKLKNIFEKREKFTILENSVEKIKKHILLNLK